MKIFSVLRTGFRFQGWKATRPGLQFLPILLFAFFPFFRSMGPGIGMWEATLSVMSRRLIFIVWTCKHGRPGVTGIAHVGIYILGTVRFDHAIFFSLGYQSLLLSAQLWFPFNPLLFTVKVVGRPVLRCLSGGAGEKTSAG